jgi:aryl-alcohol dehydrogenase-like predicted oxidoreductase
VSRIALGTVQFGMTYGIANQFGQVSRHEARLILAYAANCKVSVIDTAIAYGNSEACLGAIGVKNFKIVTKLPPLPASINTADVRNWVHSQVTASLSRLGVTTLYGLLLHKPDQLLGSIGVPLVEALLELKAQGLIAKLGVSIYAPEELATLEHAFPLELIQAPFNPFDRRLLKTGWLGRLKERGIEVHTRSTFLQGLLLLPMEFLLSEFDQWTDLWQAWHHWLAKNNLSALQACLAFALSHSEIERVVVGADNVDQLRQIISAVSIENDLRFPDFSCDDLNLIDPSRWNK